MMQTVVFIVLLMGIYEVYTQCVEQIPEITYRNNQNKVVNSLPTIRLMQGWWGSQSAAQYIVYVYLKEFIGLNVTFFPGEPGSIDTYLADNPQYSYPSFYYDFIEEDKYDLLFEDWGDYLDSQYQEYQQREKIMWGSSNVYGTSAFFIPKYMYSDAENAKMILLQNLRDDPNIRQQYINAYTLNSTNDWVNISQHQYNINAPYNMDYPTYDKPIIFGSYSWYLQSEHAHKLVNNLLGHGLNWSFVTLESEKLLTDFVLELYKKGLPFIANLYAPHQDLDTIINSTTDEIMEFEYIPLPRNPSNLLDDPCYIDGECAWPQTALLKIGNAKLFERFPEIIEFFQSFTLSTTKINEILGYYNEYSSLLSQNSSESQIWELAACKWLKTQNESNSSIVHHWHFDIIRVDCVHNEYTINGNGEYICIENSSISMMQLFILSIIGIVTFVLFVFVGYKIYKLCKSLQRDWTQVNKTDTRFQKLKKEQKKKIFTSVIENVLSLLLGVSDFITDMIAFLTIMVFSPTDSYSFAFLMVYLVMMVIASFVSIVHFLVVIRNISKKMLQLKTGKVIENGHGCEIHEDADFLVTLQQETMIKLDFVEKRIKDQSTTIFVGLLEDIPFLVLNYILIFGSDQKEVSTAIFLSLTINILSIGYKVCILKEFFGNLSEKHALQNSLQAIQAESVRHTPKSMCKQKTMPIAITYTPGSIEFRTVDAITLNKSF